MASGPVGWNETSSGAKGKFHNVLSHWTGNGTLSR